MLPKGFPPFSDRLDINIYGKVTPAKEVGGDLYDFCVRQEKLFFCIGDVSGKGVPASLVMAMTRSLFRGAVAHEERADAIMCEMNKALTEQNSQNMFLTLFLGVLDLPTGKLDYCNAGHNAPILVTQGSQPSLAVVANLPMGIVADFPYQAQSVQLSRGDLLFLYTDGLTEAENTEHDQFGEQRMTEVLASLTDSRPRHVADTMQAAVEAFVGDAEQSDDLTMLAIRYQTPAIVMRNDIQQIPTLAEWIDDLGIPDELNMPVNLALEEIVSNVMLYAYPHEKSGKVLIEAEKSDTKITFVISDSGIAFDPTAQPPADITLSAEDRAIGGLGIHLVRQIMDSIAYRREDGKNILTLVKKI
jgi:sigma-B regulation protein RsbU (phosphoserine phosphatase)